MKDFLNIRIPEQGQILKTRIKILVNRPMRLPRHKETVVLRRWGRSKQKFGFIKRVDKY